MPDYSNQVKQIQNTPPAQFFTEDFLAKLAVLVSEMLRGEKAMAYQLYEAVANVMSKAGSFEGTSVFQKAYDIHKKLRMATVPYLPSADFISLIQNAYIETWRRDNEFTLPFSERIQDRMSTIYDIPELENTANGVVAALKRNNELLGPEAITLTRSSAKKSQSLSNWIADYDEVFGVELQPRTSLISYLNQNKNVAKLSSGEKFILRQAIELYEIMKSTLLLIRVPDIFVQNQTQKKSPNVNTRLQDYYRKQRESRAGQINTGAQVKTFQDLRREKGNVAQLTPAVLRMPTHTPASTVPPLKPSATTLVPKPAAALSQKPTLPVQPPLPPKPLSSSDAGRSLSQLMQSAQKNLQTKKPIAPPIPPVLPQNQVPREQPKTTPSPKPPMPAWQAKPVQKAAAPLPAFFKKESPKPIVQPPLPSKTTPSQARPADIVKQVTDEVLEKAGKAVSLTGMTAEQSMRLSLVIGQVLRGLKSKEEMMQTLGQNIAVGGVGLAVNQVRTIADISAQLASRVKKQHARPQQVPSSEHAFKKPTTPLSQNQIRSPQATPIKQVQPPVQPPRPAYKPVEHNPFIPPRQPVALQQKQQMPAASSAPVTKSPADILRIHSVDELESLKMGHFRPLGKFDIGSQLVLEAVSGMVKSKDQFTSPKDVVTAWKKSEPYQLYIEIGRKSMMDRKSVGQLARERKEEGKSYITEEEFVGVADLSKKIQEL